MMSTAVDHAYAIIREDILSGRLRPGDRLREEDLTRRIGVSRTPVREALRRLETDGYVVVQPNKGAVVPVLTVREIEDIYAVRVLIEGEAARLAASRIKPAQIAQMRVLNEELRTLEQLEYPPNDDARRELHLRRTDLNWALHEIVFAAAANARLMAIARQLVQTALSAQMLLHYSPAERSVAILGHEDIIDALAAADSARAEAAMRAHIEAARDVLLARLAKPPGASNA